MLAKHKNQVRAVIRCKCLTCLGEGYVANEVCGGCKGEEEFFLETEEACIEDVHAWEDGPAWDAVYDKIAANGAEPHDDAWAYKIHNLYHDGETYELTLKIIPHPVSKETAEHFNSLTKGAK
jgi:hypothetical protein